MHVDDSLEPGRGGWEVARVGLSEVTGPMDDYFSVTESSAFIQSAHWVARDVRISERQRRWVVFAESFVRALGAETGRSLGRDAASSSIIHTVLRTVSGQIVIALARTGPSSPTCICSQGPTSQSKFQAGSGISTREINLGKRGQQTVLWRAEGCGSRDIKATTYSSTAHHFPAIGSVDS